VDDNALMLAHESDAENDSVFIPIADLFTLLSLSVIYVILVFGTPTGAQTTEPVLTAAQPGTGPGAAINPLDVYVSMATAGNLITYSITRGGVTYHDSVSSRQLSAALPADWLTNKLLAMKPERFVIVYLPPNENSDLIKSRYTDAERLVHQLFPTQARNSL
jgi:hypothetical protein